MKNRFLMGSLGTVLIVVLLFSLSACGGNPKKELAGSWTKVSGDTDIAAFTLYSDGTCSVTNDSNRTDEGKWELVDDTLKILGNFGGQFWDTDNLVGKYTLKSETLTFIAPTVDGDKIDTDIVFQKID